MGGGAWGPKEVGGTWGQSGGQEECGARVGVAVYRGQSRGCTGSREGFGHALARVGADGIWKPELGGRGQCWECIGSREGVGTYRARVGRGTCGNQSRGQKGT